MVEGDGKYQAYQNKPHQNCLITRTNHHQPNEADCQDDKLSGQDVGQNRAYKKSFLALEQRTAIWAVMSELEGTADDRCLAASGTAQTQGAR